jgi:putative transposase
MAPQWRVSPAYAPYCSLALNRSRSMFGQTRMLYVSFSSGKGARRVLLLYGGYGASSANPGERRYASGVREAITRVRQVLPFRINAWVLLPDHLHTIWTLPEGDADFSNRWRLIKRHVTRTCGPAYLRPDFLTPRRSAKQCGTLWQHRFWEHLIRDERDFRQHMDYLHANPLKHGYVACAADWPWSSFHRCVRQGIYPADWAGGAGNDAVHDVEQT